MPPPTPFAASVTVVIPAFNEEANLARIVRQVLDEAWSAELRLDQVIVVDDCSDDDTPAIAARLEREDTRIRVIRNARRSGKNAGIRGATAASRSEVIAIVDADVLLVPGCLVKTIHLLAGDPGLMASSCIIEPLPARSWRERASASQALLVAELKRLGCAYLSALYAVKAPAFGALDLPDDVADDAYITLWLRAHGYRYAVRRDALAYIRAATGLRDFARQTLRGRRGEAATAQTISGDTPGPDRRRVLPHALARTFVRDPFGFTLYVIWYAVVLATPRTLWLPMVNLSTFDTVRSTKDVSVRARL